MTHGEHVDSARATEAAAVAQALYWQNIAIALLLAIRDEIDAKPTLRLPKVSAMMERIEGELKDGPR